MSTFFLWFLNWFLHVLSFMWMLSVCFNGQHYFTNSLLPIICSYPNNVFIFVYIPNRKNEDRYMMLDRGCGPRLCHSRSPWWRRDWWHPLASEDVYIMLVQGCSIQMDLGHPLSVRDTAVWEVPSSLLLLSYAANESFKGRRGFSVSAQGFQGARWRCAPECIYGFLTSHQSSRAHGDLLFPFVWKRENDFQCNILKCWDLRIWREHCEKVKDTVK